MVLNPEDSRAFGILRINYIYTSTIQKIPYETPFYIKYI